jgi:hypothetical protein
VASVPEGTDVEAGAPSPCGDLPPADGALTAVLDGDFTVRFSASWWAAGTPVDEALRACAAKPGASRRWTHLGAEFTGRVSVRRGPAGQPVLLQVWAPTPKAALATDAFEAWTAAVGHR